MPRLFPLFAITATLATAVPLFAEGFLIPSYYLPSGPPTSRPGYFIWAPVQNVSSMGDTIELQYAAPAQSQTAYLRVFLPDDTFGLSSPDPLATVSIPDLTGWRKSLASLGAASQQEPAHVINLGQHSDFPVRQGPDKTQVFNIAIGTQF